MKYIHKLNGFLGVVAGGCICMGLALILIEILVRKLLGTTLYIVDEYTAYLTVGFFYLALGYTQRDGAHIRMTLFRNLVGSKVKERIELVCYFVAICFGVFLTYAAFMLFYESVMFQSKAMSISETYLAIPQAAMPIGAAAYTLQLLVLFFETVGRVLHPVDDSMIRVT